MDRRVLAHVDGDLSRANVAPHKRRSASCRGYAARAASATTADGGTAAGGRRHRVRPRRRSRCPGCGYEYDEVDGRRARGVRGRHAVGRRPRLVVLPGLRRSGQGRLRGRAGGRVVTAVADDRRPRAAAIIAAAVELTTVRGLVRRHDGTPRRRRRGQPPDRLQRGRHARPAWPRPWCSHELEPVPRRRRRRVRRRTRDDLHAALQAAVRGVLRAGRDNALLRAVVGTRRRQSCCRR